MVFYQTLIAPIFYNWNIAAKKLYSLSMTKASIGIYSLFIGFVFH